MRNEIPQNMHKFIGGLLLAVIIPSTPHTIEYDSGQEHVVYNKYDIELNQWMDKLGDCESGNNPKALNPDDVGSRSVGLHQYKDATWAGYNKKFDLGFTAEDIWDGEKQRIMTYHVIKHDYAWRNWYNCVANLGVGYPPKYYGDDQLTLAD